MATLYPYGQHLADRLANPPEAGRGRHTYLFSIAASFHRLGVPMDEIKRRLEASCRRAGWHDRIADIPRDLAKIGALDQDAEYGPRVWFPEASQDARRIAAKASPMFSPTDTGLRAHDVLPALYGPDAWVCVASDAQHATTQRLEDVLPIAERMPFVVANAMTAARGKTKMGNPSARCHGNACAPALRRFVVVEFDTGEDLAIQARYLSALHRPACPLALVVFSGGKSLHGWFNVAGLPEAEKLTAFRRGCLLGADQSLWDRAKLVRMPGGTRHDGTRQFIAYFEPEHI